MKGNRKCIEFTDDVESFGECLLDVSDMLIKAEFIFEGESKLFEATDLSYCPAVNGERLSVM